MKYFRVGVPDDMVADIMWCDEFDVIPQPEYSKLANDMANSLMSYAADWYNKGYANGRDDASLSCDGCMYDFSKTKYNTEGMQHLECRRCLRNPKFSNRYQPKEDEQMDFEFGDYVVYEPGYKEPEIGRVASKFDDDYFVCYHCGCTSSSTHASMLRPATEDEVRTAPKDLGYHRFDDHCPDFDENTCFRSCIERFCGDHE